MNNGIRKHRAAVFAVVLALTINGAWLIGMFEMSDQSAEVSRTELTLAILGFILFVSGLTGIALLVRQDIKPWSNEQLVQWERIRAQGRTAYLKDAILKGLILAFLVVSTLSIIDYWRTRSTDLILASLWIYGALFIVYVFGMYYAAHRSWNANEEHYQNGVASSKQT